jgi:hypothetical protein
MSTPTSLEEMETMPKLTANQLFEAIRNLYEALRILKSVLKKIERSAIRRIEISKSLAAAWFQVNCCRLYTEPHLNLEELNVETMGLIHDAKRMLKSLVSWQKGRTLHGKLLITQSIREATGNLNLVLTQLENLQSNETSEKFAITA